MISDKDKFNLNPSIVRTADERIEMVLDNNCPIEVLKIVAESDSDLLVVESCIYNNKTTDEILEIVSERTKKSVKELNNLIQSKNEMPNNVINSIKNLKKTICTVPWNHVEIQQNGELRMCCLMIDDDDDIKKGILVKDDGRTLYKNDNLSEYRNIASWKKIRKDFLDGGKPKLCNQCWDDEKISNGKESQRLFELRRHDNQIFDIIKKTKKDGSINHNDFPIKSYDLRFGNKCNLKCRTCGPQDSNQWIDDNYKLHGTKFMGFENKKSFELNMPESYQWYNNSVAWNNVVENLENIKYYYFTGGEPTINEKHKELLQLLIEKKLNQIVDLRYNTNMATLPDDVIDLWSKFENVGLGMSIDGIENHFTYIRHPGNWKSAERGIQKIDRDTRLKNITACFTTTLSILNVLHILDMFDYTINNSWNRIDSNIIVRCVRGPEYYNIQNLPEYVKNSIKKRYMLYIKNISKKNISIVKKRHINNILNQIISYMYEKEPNEMHFERFFTITEKLDTIRNENWKISLPELYSLLKDET